MSRPLHLLLPLLLIGCSLSESGKDIATPLVQTEQTVYTATPIPDSAQGIADYSFSMQLRYENRTGSTIYLRSCGNRPLYAVTTLESDTSQSGYQKYWACGAPAAIPLRPSEVRQDTFQIEGPTVRDGQTHEPIGVLEGSFRFLYSASRDETADGSELPDRLSRSNVFEVRIAE